MIIRSKAPLRLGLAGGGTDVSPYCDMHTGYVLNATIDMFAYCTLETNEWGGISFHAADLDKSFESETTDFLKLDGTLDLHKAVYNRVVRDFNSGQPIPLKMTTYSDAPAGSGLGSSSTMVVAMLKSFVELLNIPLGEYDVAHLAYEIERIDVGLMGGRQDQFAATFGGFNFMEFYAENRVIVNPLRIKNWIVNELENSMVLYFTGTSRDSAKIIEEQSRNAQDSEKDSLAAMHELKGDSTLLKEALLKGDFNRFAYYIDKSWAAKKKTAHSISNSFIDEAYTAAKKAGAYSGKVSGAGGGGFMMFIVDPVRRLQVIKVLNELGGKVMSFHFYQRGTQAWRI